MNPYQVLGVSTTSSEADIKKAYRRLSRKYHPDAGGDPAKFDMVVKAYKMLTKTTDIPVIKKKHLHHVSLFTYAVVQ